MGRPIIGDTVYARMDLYFTGRFISQVPMWENGKFGSPKPIVRVESINGFEWTVAFEVGGQYFMDEIISLDDMEDELARYRANPNH